MARFEHGFKVPSLPAMPKGLVRFADTVLA